MPFHVVPFRDRLLNRLVKRAEPVHFGRGEVVVRAGEPARHALLVREGHLAVRETADGAAEGRTTDLVFPWELGAMEAVETDAPYRMSYVADEPARVQLLDGRGVRRVLKRAEGTFDAWRRADGERASLLARLGPGGSTPAALRLGAVLVHLAERAGGEEAPGTLAVRIQHRVLGELAGLHRSTVTTLLNDWLYEDVLETLDPGWRIVDREALVGGGSPR